MGYLIYTVPQITPRQVERPGILAPDIIENPAPITLPVGATVIYQPDMFDRFADDPAQRLLLLTTPDGVASYADILAAFPDIRNGKEQAIRLEGGRRLKALATPYGPEEREGWESQKQQARAWLADPTTPTPTITAMATARGITIEVMVTKIIENVVLYETAYGQIVGEQQRLLDLVYAATDYDSMMEVTWP